MLNRRDLLAAFAISPTLAAARAAVEETGEQRLAEMRRLAKNVTISVMVGDDRRAVDLVPQPMNRYDDQPREIRDGTLWAFGGKGRPAAALKVELYPERGLYGLVSLAPGRITAEGVDGWRWEATEPGLAMRPLPNAPAPAGMERQRLVQMKTIARRFSSHQFDGPARGRLDLRLLPQPIHRFAEPAAGLIDGAIFALVFGTNPEVLIVLEARKQAGTSSWQYGLARLGGGDVWVELDGREVWTQPAARPPVERETYMNRFLKREGAASPC